MLNTEQLGLAFQAFYDDGSDMANYYENIKRNMSSNQRIIERNRKILANLKVQMEDIDLDYQMFVDLSKKREQDRKKYDHYRTKLAKLYEQQKKNEQKTVSSGVMMFGNKNKAHEKLVRNQGKFEKAEHYFVSATKTMDDKISVLMKKLDQIAIFLNIKFFQNITLTFYKTQDELYSKYSNVENELQEIKYRMDRQVIPSQNSGNNYGYDKSQYQGQGYAQ